MIKLAADISNLHKFMRYIVDRLTEIGVTGDAVGEIELAAEEVMVNVFNYGYPGEKGDVEVGVTEKDGQLFIKVIDQGTEFDMTKAAAPDVNAPIEERPIGGLGIYLAKQLMDEVTYQRVGDTNVLTLIKKIKGE
ncbi:ATP-binding protein [Candidatus Margulisiibacteriota bacterium]